jgi:hypothetical protein
LVVDGEPLERGHQLEVPERLAEAQAEVPERLAEVERSAVVHAGGERVPVVREELAEGLPLVLELLRYTLDLFFLSIDHACFSLFLTNFVACAGSVRFPEC